MADTDEWMNLNNIQYNIITVFIFRSRNNIIYCIVSKRTFFFFRKVFALTTFNVEITIRVTKALNRHASSTRTVNNER